MVGSENESSTPLKIDQTLSFDCKIIHCLNWAGVTLKTDINFKGINTRHMSHSGKLPLI